MNRPTVDPALAGRLREIEGEILGRAPEHDVVPTLERVAAVMELLGDPHRAFRVIHVTGTNGKTSTTRIIESLCREHGLRTGRFTSPHLHSMTERIAIDGEPVGAQVLLDTWAEIAPIIDIVDVRSAETGAGRMTFFEVLVVLAFAIFADAPVDVAVVEVGMGGTWDATNVADGDVAVLTPIDIDHTRFLGSSVEAIATEKVGIIKAGAVALTSVQHQEVADLVADHCERVGARRYAAEEDFAVTAREVAVGGQLLSLRGIAGEYPEVFLPLHGEHQSNNALLAVAAVEAFLGGAQRPLDPEVVRAGLAAVTSPGRLEVVRRSPTILVDAAHNPHGAAALREALADAFSFARLVGIVAIFQDKDAATILELLEPALDHVVVTRNTSPRSMNPALLGEIASEIFGSDRVSVVPALPDAIEEALALAEQDGLGGGVIATGSIVTAADVRALLGVTDA
ncbi:MAG: bifunctional folylpolyglutamate synthase/dihydrofolate synthase [Actinomycetales bacterium]|nr:bifunctional folylpolyglutamate synthase/dihydrofolate synthase [Actinomycetales bacterium]